MEDAEVFWVELLDPDESLQFFLNHLLALFPTLLVSAVYERVEPPLNHELIIAVVILPGHQNVVALKF